MANIITPYNPIWYANRGLERLESALTFVRTMFMAYDDEPRELGDTIEIRKPGAVPVQAMPISTASDLTPSKITITLDQWFGSAFKISDKEKAYTGERIVREHIAPAMQSLAENIETAALALYKDVPWQIIGANPAVPSEVVALRKQMNQNKVPKGQRRLALNFEREEDLLNNATFAQANTSSSGAATQREGEIGRKYGFDLYQNDLLPNHTTTALALTAPLTNGIAALDATTINVDGTAVTGSVVPGDIVSFAGHTQKYAITAAATAAGNAIALSVTPPVGQGLDGRVTIADGVVPTFEQTSQGISLAYDAQAFAIVMADLPETGNGRGAEIATVGDPRTGLSLRVSRWYEPISAEEWVRFDALYGVKTLDGNRAVRYAGPTI